MLTKQHLFPQWATSRPPSNYMSSLTELHLIPHWATSHPSLSYISITMDLHVIPHWATSRPPYRTTCHPSLRCISSLIELHLDHHRPTCHPSLSCISSFPALNLIPLLATYHPHWATSHPQLAAYYFTDHAYVDFLTSRSSSFSFLYIMFYKVLKMCILLDWRLEILWDIHYTALVPTLDNFVVEKERTKCYYCSLILRVVLYNVEPEERQKKKSFCHWAQ